MHYESTRLIIDALILVGNHHCQLGILGMKVISATVAMFKTKKG